MAYDLLKKQLERGIVEARKDLDSQIEFLQARLAEATKKLSMGYAPGSAGIVQDMGSKVDAAAAKLESLLKLQDYWRGL